MSKVMDIYVNFTKTTHQIWSCHVTPVLNVENFSFFPNSVLNFEKRYQIWGILAQEQKLQARNKSGDGKQPPSPSAYQVNCANNKVNLVFKSNEPPKYCKVR